MAEHPFHGITNPESGFVSFPGQIRLTRTCLQPEGIYLMDCLQRLYLWIGAQANQNLVWQLLTPEMMSIDHTTSHTLLVLPRLETDLSSRIFTLLESNKMRRGVSPDIYLIRQGSPQEQRVLKYLIEDGHTGVTVRDVKDMNYIDFLCHVHKRIQYVV